MNEQGQVRIAVIGTGKVSQNLHLPALAKSTACELVAVCDASPTVAAAVGKRYSVSAVYTSAEELLADPEIEAVLIAVGDPLHVPLTMAALDAGKHVLVEKPLGVSSAECQPLRDKVDRSGLILQVGMMKRFDPGIEYARARVESDIGGIVSFSASYVASADRYVNEEGLFLPVIRDPAYERAAYKLERQRYYLATHGVHLFDEVRNIVGAIDSVRAKLGRIGENYSWHGLLEVGTGVIGHFEITVYAQGDWFEGLNVFGDEGSVLVNTPNPFFLRPSEVRTFDGNQRQWYSPSFADGDPYLRQLDAFANHIRDGRQGHPDLEDGIAALEVIEAVERSVEDGGSDVVVGA